MLAFLSNPGTLRLTLLTLAVVAAIIAYLCRRRRRHTVVEKGVVTGEMSGANYQALWSSEPSPLERALRGSLIFLAAIVALGFVVIVLPQGSVGNLVQLFQASRASELPSEKIALLYLGDELRGSDFQIRGIIRNISTEPITKLDAAVRLYSVENVLLETKVVRSDSEIIAPDAVSEFLLVYQHYGGQFSSYSVDFALRTGEPVSYKDRRGTRHLN